jgi:hypothetical protein
LVSGSLQPPSHLTEGIAFLEGYLLRTRDQPFLALGERDGGREIWIEAFLRSRGYVPIVVPDPETEVPEFDLQERRLFPIYDLDEPVIPSTSPSIVYGPSGFRRVDAFESVPFAIFPGPPDFERRSYLRSLGVPEELAEGNSSYMALANAAWIYRLSDKMVFADAAHAGSWDDFRAGADPPVPDGVFPYYAAYAFDWKDSWPLRNLGYRRRVSARVSRLLLDQIRLEWPAGRVAFPEILKEPRPQNGGRRRSTGKDAEKGSAPPLVLSESYKVEIDV